MFYTVYKTTNLVNGKFYIGKHKTKILNDGYMGSGKYLKHAINKYGRQNFYVEYLGVFDSEWKMNIAEKIYVVLDREISYNLCPGGHGGFGYININGFGDRTGKPITDKVRKALNRSGRKFSPESKKRIGDSIRGNKKHSQAMSKALKGKPKSEEHKQKIREAILKRNAGIV